jgi:2-C-methyl-D-erythritol 4-phosphate cytidylyltransferase
VSTVAIVLAAGSGVRMGSGFDVPKAFVPLAGRPMLRYSLDAAEACGAVDGIVLVVPATEVERARALAGGGCVRAVVPGGDSRQASVRAGLAAVPAEADVIVCHDAARPFSSPELFRRVVSALASAEPAVDGIVPAVAPADTVKRVANGLVIATIPRAEAVLAQTPQAFDAAALLDAHARALESGFEATDDAMLLEWRGGRVAVVEGEPGNLKVTTAEDLLVAERVMIASHG